MTENKLTYKQKIQEIEREVNTKIKPNNFDINSPSLIIQILEKQALNPEKYPGIEKTYK